MKVGPLSVIISNGRPNLEKNIIFKERNYLIICGMLEWDSFNPFCKIVCGCQNKNMYSSRRRINRTNKIQSPL
jgi:hypothetical protein